MPMSTPPPCHLPHIRFPGQIGAEAPMFLLDPSGNVLELKAFKDPRRLFAR